jgi:hypothetical protein
VRHGPATPTIPLKLILQTIHARIRVALTREYSPLDCLGLFCRGANVLSTCAAKWGSIRIATDGRDSPKAVEPSFEGYSIGKWIDGDGSGHF